MTFSRGVNNVALLVASEHAALSPTMTAATSKNSVAPGERPPLKPDIVSVLFEKLQYGADGWGAQRRFRPT